MTDLTTEKIRLTMLAIRALRLVGKLGEDEAVSPDYMAGVSRQLGCPVDAKTFRTAESRSLALARLALEAHSQTLKTETLKS